MVILCQTALMNYVSVSVLKGMQVDKNILLYVLVFFYAQVSPCPAP